MCSRPLRVVATAVSLLLSGTACDGDHSPVTARGPHLVLLSIDTLRADHLGCYGYGRDTSPVLDGLAQQSLLFEDVLATSSSTAPSHMTLFSGVLPRVHGIMNAVLHQQTPRVRLLAEMLAEQGYHTAAFADGGLVSDAVGFDRGFEHFESRYELFDDKLDRIADWLEGAGDEPTFLFVHTYGVHAPYIPTRAHDLFSDPDYHGPLSGRDFVLEVRLREERVEDLAVVMGAFWEGRKEFDEADVQHLIDLYDGAIHRVDAGVGRLIGMLERKGWLDDAWLVVTADHGEAFREHGTFQHRHVHQEELRVPLLVRPPGGLPGGRRLPWPVTQLDLTPTLLAALGLPPEPGLQGRAMWPLDEPPDAGPDRPRFATGGDGQRYDVVVAGERKLVLRLGEVNRLYDLGSDPGEQHDLGPADPTPAWRALLERQLDDVLAASARLRAQLGEPAVGGELTPDQRADLEALGYLR